MERREREGNVSRENGAPTRLLSVDAFRGVTVAAMLLVNNPGSWAAVWAPLEHAAWHGWTPTDLIFPFFLFVVGITTHLSLRGERKRGATVGAIARKIAKRAAIIFLLGLALSAFPFVELGAIPGSADPSIGDRVLFRLETFRIPGVLQRIALVYFAVGLWELRTSSRVRRGIASPAEVVAVAVILAGYWAALTLVPVPGSGLSGTEALNEPGATLAAWSDRAVFGSAHLYRQAKEWDPEGALSTIPAIATGLLGLFAGRWITGGVELGRKVALLAAAGGAGIVLGLAWGVFFPINKNLWTSSYVVFTAGCAAVGLATFAWLLDIRGARAAAMPWVVFGVNPLLAFVGSGVMARLLTSVVKVEWEGRGVPLQKALYETALASWLPPHAASFAWAAAFVCVWALLLWPLWKRGILWKV
ncbi:MAG: acyltransferase family protein [Thermoanaerobaculia bacterium]